MRDDVTTVAELTHLVREFVAERHWEPFHDPKNLAMSIAIEAAELMEQFQWLRSDQLHDATGNPDQLAQIRDEVADITAYLLSFAACLGLDLSTALEEKMRKNALKYPAQTFRGRFK